MSVIARIVQSFENGHGVKRKKQTSRPPMPGNGRLGSNGTTNALRSWNAGRPTPVLILILVVVRAQERWRPAAENFDQVVYVERFDQLTDLEIHARDRFAEDGFRAFRHGHALLSRS